MEGSASERTQQSVPLTQSSIHFMHHGEQKGSVVLFEELGNAADASRAWGYSAAE